MASGLYYVEGPVYVVGLGASSMVCMPLISCASFQVALEMETGDGSAL